MDKSLVLEDRAISANTGSGKARRRRGKGEKAPEADEIPAGVDNSVIEKGPIEKSSFYPGVLSTLIAISMSSFFLGFWIKSKIYG